MSRRLKNTKNAHPHLMSLSNIDKHFNSVVYAFFVLLLCFLTPPVNNLADIVAK